MRNTIEQPIEVEKLPMELLRNMPDVQKDGFVRITYETVDVNGFTEEQANDIREAIRDAREHPEDFVGPFSGKEASAYLRSLCNED